MLITGTFVARRTTNRMIDKTQARIRHAFQFRNSTIVGAGILHLHDG
jgi:hypothetical protein